MVTLKRAFPGILACALTCTAASCASLFALADVAPDTPAEPALAPAEPAPAPAPAPIATSSVPPVSPLPPADELWRKVLDDRLSVFGHRNVIAIVDSAYPAHSAAGIETIATGSTHEEVVASVLDTIRKKGHIRPRVFLDRELHLVPEADAAGINAFRARLTQRLDGVPVETLSHDVLIARLDKAAATFRVLILKSDLALPYTSVFVKLECGYWNDDAEKRLREASGEKWPPRSEGAGKEETGQTDKQ